MEMMAFRRTRRNELPINADCRRSHKASFSSFFPFPPPPPSSNESLVHALRLGVGRGTRIIYTPLLLCRRGTTLPRRSKTTLLSPSFHPPPLFSITRVVIAKPILSSSNVTMRFIRDNLRGRIKGN